MEALRQVSAEEWLPVLGPVAVYWLYSAFYIVLERVSPELVASTRLHSKREEESKNLVRPGAVVRMVLFQQSVQVLLAVLLFAAMGTKQRDSEGLPSLWVQALQLLIGCLVMDAWQYFLHRLFHESRFLYRHLHSWHHRLLVPYSYGALYNHPLEGFLMDSVGGAVSFAVSGMPQRNAFFLFTIATIKTVDDHCGLHLPAYNPFHRFFRNNAAYHDVHHQVKGFRYNYSQPFFPLWDMLLGTYLPFDLVPRPGGGVEACPRLPRAKAAPAAAGGEGAKAGAGADARPKLAAVFPEVDCSEPCKEECGPRMRPRRA